jgi:molybdenum-dependent DNA-binding transcriptional regulator ModE
METLTMSAKELRRAAAFSRVQDRSWSLAEAARQLKISYRQAKRSWACFQQAGAAGLPHRLRGRPSNHGGHSRLRERVLELFREKYADYGPTLAAECLAADDGLPVSVSSLRRWLLAEGLWTHERRRAKHRRRRARRERLGDLLQMDGSHHDWFEGRRGWAVLMVIIDDASGTIYARFFEGETLAAVQETFGRYVRRHGLPLGLYVDQAGIYRSDREPTAEELAGEKRPETQFGRALRELDVELILAHSPQAKGRVERVNRTLQDRLVKALRRAGISDLAAANAFLEKTFLSQFNVRFGKPAADSRDAHRPLPASVDLDRILSVREMRTVQHDWTVRWKNRFLQLPRESASLVRPRQTIEVCEQPDGRVRLFSGDQEWTWTEAGARSGAPRQRPPRTGPTGSSQGNRPAANHPWRGRKRVEVSPQPVVLVPG